MSRTTTLTAALTLIAACLPSIQPLPAADTAPPTRNAKDEAQNTSVAPAVVVDNFTDNETIRYPVPLIRGKIADTSADSVTVINTTEGAPVPAIEALAHRGRFKALTELRPGPNKLIIRSGPESTTLTINYEPQTNPRTVRVVYLTDETGATDYQSPLPDDPRNYAARLDTAMKLLQSFTAESLNDAGLGRLTFNLELDDGGRTVVHTLNTGRSTDELYRMTGLELWHFTGRLIRRRLPDRNAKYLAIPAFTRFDPATRKTRAHTALGGGNLALFGGANLFTWPSTIAEVQQTFSNADFVDTDNYLSDSAYRNTWWATASTTLGAALHELGHTFGLPHSTDPRDIMTRGFDQFNRAFTLVEPPCAQRRRPRTFADRDIARWAEPSAAWLRYNRWFALDDRPFRSDNSIRIALDDDSEEIAVDSSNGIGALVLTAGGNAETTIPVPTPHSDCKHLSIVWADYADTLSAEDAAIRVLDTQGLDRTVKIADLTGAAALPEPMERPE